MKRTTKDLKKASLHSTMVIRRKKAVLDLAASLQVLGATCANSLEERLRPVLAEGEDMPDVRHLLRLLERLVRRTGDELDEADGDRFVRGMRLRVLREQTRKTKAELHGEMVKVRKALVDLYGSSVVRFQFGLAERTPRGTADLADEAWRLAARLDDPELVLPEPLAPGLVPDVEGWVESLKPLVSHLDQLLKELERRRVGAGDGVIEQRRAMAACDETYLLVARTAEALFRLGGENELARRLRPKVERTRKPSPIAPATTDWWAAAVAAGRRLCGFVARSAETVLDWMDSPKPLASRLARRSPKTPNL